MKSTSKRDSAQSTSLPVAAVRVVAAAVGEDDVAAAHRR